MTTDFKKGITILDRNYANKSRHNFAMPIYNGKTHYEEIAKSQYFQALTVFRHNIKKACDFYWSDIQGAYNVDLFMLTQSVSSPMGPGSDSEAIEFEFGNQKTFLVDSSQFGFEPLLLNGIKKVYCYLPSMRGENPDKRHLNQFYHCEAEILGKLDDLKPQIEGFIKFLSETMLAMPNLLNLLSINNEISSKKLKFIIKSNKFKEIEFNKAIQLLKNSGNTNLINETKFGSDILCKGELKLMELINTNEPIWINHYDRDRVAFYQKPYKNNKVINSDLLFPPLTDDSFGGEIVGSGQRQDKPSEMYESLKRQGLDSKPYEWYINLRKLKKYKTTSGFGMGIERFIAWALCRDSIQDVILYPRLKNTVCYP